MGWEKKSFNSVIYLIRGLESGGALKRSLEVKRRLGRNINGGGEKSGEFRGD